MNSVIPGLNLKILGKAIHALAKIGDEIYFEANEDDLSLRTVNISTTVFGYVKFFSPFFTHYKVNLSESENVAVYADSQKGISCKMPMKALLGAFKSPNQMEKQVETCKIELNENPTKILLKFKYKNNVTKVQNIWLLDGDEYLQVVNLIGPETNKISASSSVYTQALSNFQISDDEVSFDVSPEKIIIRNYIEGEICRINHVRSQISLSSSEFSLYKITKNTSITVSLKPFRAAVQFAENFNMNVTLTFQQSGKPLELTISNNITFEANFILATMNSDGETQSTVNLQEKNANWDLNSEEVNQMFKTKDVVVQCSPESPRTKKLKFIFQRCFEPSLDGSVFNDDEIYAANSDQE